MLQYNLNYLKIYFQYEFSSFIIQLFKASVLKQLERRKILKACVYTHFFFAFSLPSQDPPKYNSIHYVFDNSGSFSSNCLFLKNQNRIKFSSTVIICCAFFPLRFSPVLRHSNSDKPAMAC